MYWLLGAALPGALALAGLLSCGKSRETQHKPPPKAKAGPSNRSQKSSKSGKSTHSKKSSSTRRGKSSKSRGSRNSKSGKKPTADKSTKTAKSVRSAKSSKSGRSSKGPPNGNRSSNRKQGASAAQIRADKEADALAKRQANEMNERQTQGVGHYTLQDAQTITTVPVTMKPEALMWTPAGGMQQIRISNDSNEKRAIKVKCSDNIAYRVNPVHAFINPHESIQIMVLRQGSEIKTDKLVVVTAPVPASGEDDPKTCFAADAERLNEMLQLPLLVNESSH